MEPSSRRGGPGSRASAPRKLAPLSAPLAAPFVATVVRAPLEPLEGYRILARLGHGGMAEALLARGAPGSPELVVVKRLHSHLEDDPQVVQMFVDEARLACRLDHHAIVRSFAVGALEGRRAIVMEFLDGQPLQRVVRRAQERGVTLSIDLVGYWFLNVLGGLHYAHEMKDANGRSLRIVHRDVSPHNLFLTYDGTIKLLDFGIAKTAVQEGRTRTGLLKGKAAYMAPEQARAEVVDRRADVWSTGVVLWEALTGARLFKAEHEAGSLNLTLTRPIPSVREWRRDVPSELEAIVARALERDRDKRYPSAQAMAQDLRELFMQRRASVGTAGRELMAVLFAAEIPERRTQVRALLASTDNVPISSSLPPVTTATASLPTDASSVNEFVNALNRRNRLTLGALVAAVICLLGGGALLFAVARRAPAVAVPLPPEPALERRAARPSEVAPVLTAMTGARVPHVEATPSQTPAPAASAAPAHTVTPRRGEASRETTPRTESQRREPPTPNAAIAEPELERSPPAAQSEDGYLTLDTTPWSMVSMSGVSLGQTPIVRVRLPAGKHHLVLVNPELGRKTSYDVTIEPGKVTARRIGLE